MNVNMSAKAVVAAAVAIALSAPAIAADLPTTKGPPPAPPALVVNDIIAANNQLSVDFLATSFGYTEYSAFATPVIPLGAKADTEGGWVPGINVDFSLMKNWFVDNAYFDAQLSWSGGNTHYVGSNIKGGTPYGSVTTSDSADVFDTDFRFGKGFAIQNNFMLTPYLGFGTHYWSRGPNPEDYSDDYLGGGLLAQVAVAPKFVLSGYGLIGGTLGSHFSTSPTPTGSVGSWSSGLGNSVIYKAGISADYALTANIHINAGLDYVNFAYGESGASPYQTVEPHSTTSNLMLKVGLGYAF
jgi:hypothetical protein